MRPLAILHVAVQHSVKISRASFVFIGELDRDVQVTHDVESILVLGRKHVNLTSPSCPRTAWNRARRPPKGPGPPA